MWGGKMAHKRGKKVHVAPKRGIGKYPRMTNDEILDVFTRLGLSDEYKRAAYLALGGSAQFPIRRTPLYYIRFSSSTG
jgi:hypothetical protein